jgi:D-3-phosphoglycerate dehydrogenase/C-terminal binding protein
MLRGKVIVTDLFTGDLELERSVLGSDVDLLALGAKSEEQLQGQVEDADALICNHEITIGPATIDRLKKCKVIVRCGVGYDNIDHSYARSRQIKVANVPDYGTEEVADSAIGLTLALTRGIHLANSRLRAGQGPWSFQAVAPLQRMRGEVFGVVGFGAIGMAATQRALAFGMRVICFDPYMRAGFDKVLGVERVSTLEELLQRAYVVSLHCGLSKHTHHLLDARALGQMRPGSFLINTARGPLVDTRAVPNAIRGGRLGGAGFDVIEAEDGEDHDPLIRAWRDPEHPAHHRVIINPHIAFYAQQAERELRIKAALACRESLSGRSIPNVVNP